MPTYSPARLAGVAVTTEVIPDNTIRVLDHGFVRLDDAMADDLSVVNGARVSFARRKDAGQAERKLESAVETDGRRRGKPARGCAPVESLRQKDSGAHHACATAHGWWALPFGVLP